MQIQAEETLLQQVLPKMLVQPLVENAVLHGLEPKMEKGQVDVRFQTMERKIYGLRWRMTAAE